MVVRPRTGSDAGDRDTANSDQECLETPPMGKPVRYRSGRDRQACGVVQGETTAEVRRVHVVHGVEPAVPDASQIDCVGISPTRHHIIHEKSSLSHVLTFKVTGVLLVSLLVPASCETAHWSIDRATEHDKLGSVISLV